jgi:hypothetical protein
LELVNWVFWSVVKACRKSEIDKKDWRTNQNTSTLMTANRFMTFLCTSTRWILRISMVWIPITRSTTAIGSWLWSRCKWMIIVTFSTSTRSLETCASWQFLILYH